MPEWSVRSSLRRSRGPTGALLLLCLLLLGTPAAWAQAPAPDPPPSGLAPDPPPDAAAPPPPAVAPAAPRVAGAPATTPAPAPQRAEQAPPVKPKQKPNAQAAAPPPTQPVDSEPRDSLMPRGELAHPARVLERSRLLLAGLALVVVALGGAVVLGVGRRQLVEART